MRALVATVVPCESRVIAARSMSWAAPSSRKPAMTACAGFAGVDATLYRTMRSSASSNAKKSVKVPPTSTPIIQAIRHTPLRRSWRARAARSIDTGLSYGCLAQACVCATMPRGGTMSWVGQSIERVEDAALLTGRGRYIDDLAVPPGCLHAAVLRSPHPHALIRSIDVSAAMGAKGVAAVVTGADVTKLGAPLLAGVK